MGQELRQRASELTLNEFKALHRAWKTSVPWFDHLLLGLLVWLEQKLIDHRVTTEVDEAIKEWETLHPSKSVSPVITESPSDTSTRLPEMRLSAPWYEENSD